MVTMPVEELQNMIQEAVQVVVKREFAPLRRQFEERLISLKDTATTLGVTKQTLYNMEQRGDLIPVRISPKKIMYRESDITQYLSNHK